MAPAPTLGPANAFCIPLGVSAREPTSPAREGGVVHSTFLGRLRNALCPGQPPLVEPLALYRGRLTQENRQK